MKSYHILKALSVSAIMATLAPLSTGAQPDPIIGRHQLSLQSDRMTPEVLWAMGRIGNYAISPDGKQICYQVSYYSVELNKSHTVLFLMNIDGSNVRQLTTSASNESDPAWINGGQRIAFLSKGNLWSMRTDGTDRRQHSSKGDIEGFRFSPDEQYVCYIAQIPSTTSIAAQEPDLPQATGLVINDLNFKHWDQYVQTIPHLFVSAFSLNGSSEATFSPSSLSAPIDILEGEPFEAPVLPFGGTEQYAWSPNSKQIAYTSRKKTGVAYAVSTDTDIFLYDLTTRTTRNLCKPADYIEPAINTTLSMAQQSKNQSNADINAGYDQNPIFSPDGKKIAWTSMERDGYESDRLRLCVLDLENNTKTYVTESFQSGIDAFVWNTNSKELFFIGVWNARTHAYKTNLKGEITQLTFGDYDYAALELTPNGKQLIVKRHSISAPDDLYAITLGKKKNTVEALTRVNEHILSQLALGKVEERTVKTVDNKDMLCWVIYPSHFDPAKKYPTLLFCEGGPQSPVSQFWSYRWNFQIMAANDYIIIAPNRRGLPGFGMKWLEEISGDYTGLCMQDYLSAIDDLCREPYVDKNRLGCVGASFGGYSVYWLAGNHDKRFKAFIAHDGIFNTQQQYYETEEMWFPNWDLGGAPEHFGISASEQSTTVSRNAFNTSPHLYVDRWDTPILCIHGEKDYRILHSQGQAAFNAARMHGVDAQLLLFPDENHWVLKPQNGILWQRTFFRWLDKYLK